MLNWPSRGHTDLELCKCHFKFSWTSALEKNSLIAFFLLLQIKKFIMGGVNIRENL